jgi:c-di-GMP-related signal transduction protein
MDVFVAKQPIFNIEEEIVGYELLYRKDFTNVYPYIDGDQASAEVIINTFFNIGLERLTEGKMCCFHFTEKLLEQQLPTFFNPNEVVVKINQKVEASRKLVCILRELKEKDYMIMVNACIFHPDNPISIDLLPFIDLIKVDFRENHTNQQERIEKISSGYDIKLLAEKIESKEAYEEAKRRGYELFQGYLFGRPQIESTFEVPIIFSSYRKLMQNMPSEGFDEDELADLIEKDLSLSLKLLKLIQISSVHEENKICSIREGISLLGANKIMKWTYILASREPIEKKAQLSERLVRLTLTRAKLCETIAGLIGVEETEGFYMTGLISTMKEIGNQSMEYMLEELPLKEDIRDALLGKENQFKEVLDLVEAVEQAEWKDISDKCRKLNIYVRDLFRIYAESSNWTTRMLEAEKKASFEPDPFLIH